MGDAGAAAGGGALAGGGGALAGGGGALVGGGAVVGGGGALAGGGGVVAGGGGVVAGGGGVVAGGGGGAALPLADGPGNAALGGAACSRFGAQSALSAIAAVSRVFIGAHRAQGPGQEQDLTTRCPHGYAASVEPMVDLAPGAEHDPLARLFADLIRAAGGREEQRQELARMRGAVGVVADDAGTALTLRFDFGRVTVHEGLVGVPTITIRGASEDIAALANIPFGGLGLPDARSASGRGALRQLLGALRRRRLKIYGLASHPRLVLRLLRVLSRQPQAQRRAQD